MLPYFIMVGVPATFALLFRKIEIDQKKANRIIIDSFFVVFLLLLFFRSEEVGIDLSVYKWHFTQYPQQTWLELFSRILKGEIEAGYVVIVKVLSFFTNDFRWAIITCASVAVLPIWKMYREEGKLVFLTIVMFINIAPFSIYFSGLKQAMAMAFVAPCYQYCKQKNLRKFLLMVFIAFLFHRSALILLLLYPVYHLRLKKQVHMFYLLPILGVVYIFSKPIFQFLILFTGNYNSEYAAGIQVTGAYAVLLLLAVILVYCFLVPDQENIDDETAGLRNIMVLCVALQIFSGVHSIAMRMNYYFLLFVPLLVPRVIQCGYEKYEKLIRISKICMILFFTIYYFYHAMTDKDILEVYPYYSFLYDARF